MWMKTGEGRNIAILIVKLDPLYLHQCQSWGTYNRIILINGVCGRIFNSWMVTKRSSLCCFCAYVMVEISTMALFKGPWPRPQKQLIGHRVHSRGVERNVLGSNKAQHRLSSHSKSNGHRLLPWWFLFWRTERNKLQTTSDSFCARLQILHTFRNVHVLIVVNQVSSGQGEKKEIDLPEAQWYQT